jgi:hypothetical protein
MKSIQKVLIMLGVVLVFAANSASAQIYVNVRPVVPHYVRVEAPSPRHVWIDEEWEPRGGSYVFVGGHWALPPYPGGVWVGGHWGHHARGDYWVAGHWRRR